MFKTTVSFLSLLSASAGAINSAEPRAAATARSPRCFKEIGGSNYVMYNVGQKYLDGNLNAWFDPGMMQPVVATFHQQKREAVVNQLKAMHDSGQRKIAVLMWHDHLSPEQLQAGGVYGHVLASNGGVLLPQHEENLKGLLTLIRQSGFFNELVFRFAPQGAAWSDQWAGWNEDQYRENFDFIVSVRQTIREVLQGSGMKLTFDLGSELGGLTVGCTDEYTQRVWREYVTRFGSDDTFGFSIAAHPGRIARWIDVCDKTGTRPSRFALDLYKHIPEWMPGMAAEFRKAGINDPQIIVLETYYNDPQSLQELQNAAEQNGLEYLYLMQWPLMRDRTVPHFSDEAVNGWPCYDAYLIN